MAISASAVWEVRVSGNDANGGFYTSGGLDYSQQDAAQITLNDVVTNGTTTVTSASALFTGAMVGNGINIAGTIYQIAGFTSNTSIIVDRATGTGSGQAGKVGGALVSPAIATTNMVPGNTVWVKTGTYSITSTTSTVSGGVVVMPAGSASFPTNLFGYDATRGDHTGNRPLFQASGIASVAIVSLTNGGVAVVDNINVDGGTSLLNINGFALSNAGNSVSNASAINCYPSANGTGFTIGQYCFGYNLFAQNCGLGFLVTGQAVFVHAYGCTTLGISVTGGTVSRSIVWNCVIGCYINTGSLQMGGFVDCISAFNTTNGFDTNNAGRVTQFTNCLSYGNGGVGFTTTSAKNAIHLWNCAGGSNTNGNWTGSATPQFNQNFVALTANPFAAVTSSSTPLSIANFSPNNVTNGGALVRGGWVEMWQKLTATTGYSDIGAVQHQDSGGGLLYLAGMNGGMIA